MHKSTILIADDERLSRNLMQALLSTEGYNLAFARNGTEALAKAADLAPDLILLDVMMPDMDGFEVCRRLRADPLLATVPVIMVTALDDHNSRARGIEAGADDFISKPFNRAELQARVRTITRLNRYRLLREQAKFKQLYQAARQVDQLQVLNKLDQALAATLDPEKVAEITLRQISAALDAPMGALFVPPPHADATPKQAFVLGRGWVKMGASAQDVQRLQAFWQRLRQNGREIIPLSDAELATASGKHHIADRWGPGGIVAPIWNNTDLIAMLALGGRPANHPFTDEDLALIQAAASRAGQAIKNARLYQASQQQAARLSTLHAISTAAVSSLEVDTVLHQVLELTRQALNATSGSILMSAVSVILSAPTILAGYSFLPSESTTRISVAFWITWAFVRIYPCSLMMNPEPRLNPSVL